VDLGVKFKGVFEEISRHLITIVLSVLSFGNLSSTFVKGIEKFLILQSILTILLKEMKR